MNKNIHRRAFIQSAGGAIAAFGLPALLTGCGGGDSDSSPIAGNSVRRALHFDLTGNGFLGANEDFRLHVAGTHYALTAHDSASRQTYGESAATASHYAAEVHLPADRAIHIYVTQRSDRNGHIQSAHGSAVDHALAMSAIHVPRPRASVASARRRAQAGPSVGVERRSTADQTLTTDSIDSFSPADIATTLIFHHANLMAMDADMASIVMGHIENADGISDLEAAIKAAGRCNWYTMQVVLGDDDVPVVRADGTTVYQYIVKPEVMAAGQRAVASALNAVHNDPALKDLFYSSAVQDPADTSSSGAGINARARTLRSALDAQSSDGLNYTLNTDGRQGGLSVSLDSVDGNQVTLTFSSRYLRHLGLFVEFLDADGNPVAPESWTSQAAWLGSATTRLETESRKFLAVLFSPSAFLGGPISPATSTVTFNLPASASSVRLLAGGLGNGGERNADVEEMGVALTSAFNLGVPSILLATSAGYHDGIKWYDIVTPGTVGAIVDLFFSLVWGGSGGSRSAAPVVEKAAIFLADIMWKQAMKQILKAIIKEEVESVALDAIPFVGWALNAVSVAATVAQLAQTSAEVATSPWIIQNRLTVTHDIDVIVKRPADDFEFPATATHFTVVLTFSHATTASQTIVLPGTTVSDPQTVSFKNVPSGGKVAVAVTFYSSTDWVAGQVTQVNIDNLNDAGQSKLTITVTLVENLVPLSSLTQYGHKERLSVSGAGFAWQAGAAPTSTRFALSSTIRAGSLSSLIGVSANQTLGRLSYSWQGYSGNLAGCGGGANGILGYAHRTVGLTSNPNVGGKFSGCYDAAPSLVENALFTDSAGVGPNLLIAPAGDAGYTVGQFALDASGSYATGGVLGVFPIKPDVVRRFAGGVLVGISRAYQKIFHLPLAEGPMTIDTAPQATLLSGPALSADSVANNPSLLLAPVTLAVGLQDALIILEVDPLNPGGAGTLRAFNSTGVPINYFGGTAAAPTDHAITLRTSANAITYLDMRIEQKGYVYILCYEGAGSAVSDYRLDIYTPAGAYLSGTTGVAAAQFCLDAWRNVYTVNYEVLTAPNGDTEPSVSQWIPSTPKP